jgi:superfamily I DNA/RNA helicase
MRIARLIGGAGTGKTTELLRVMEGALEKLGNDPLRLGFASFTRAARGEAVERASAAWSVSPDLLSKKGWFRTVHSTAYRCIGVSGDQIIAQTQKDLEWLSSALGVGLSTEIDDETGSVRYIGDPVVAASLNCWSIARSSLMPLDEMVRRIARVDDSLLGYSEVVRSIQRYESAKRMDDRLDYTDMLLRFAGISAQPDTGYHRVKPEGELPEVSAWLFDEQQDASPLLDAVCQRLVSAPSVQWCYVVGDPFQSIYGFAGSSSKCFMSWQADKERIMPKSYRCPKPILELGERCLRNMRRGYFDRGIAPADHAGSVSEAPSIDSITETLDPRQDWLLIARTNFQASRLFASLVAAGKPAKWTTSIKGVPSRTVGLTGLYLLEQGKPITGHQWAKAIELLPTRDKAGDVFITRGEKTKWKNPEQVAKWDLIFPSELDQVGATDALRKRLASGDWVGLVDRASDWRRSAAKWGVELAVEPKVRVGTIHSVKGAEADNVAVLTTTSQRVQKGEAVDEQHDEECRIAYVAVTRARRNLHIINEGRPSTPRMEIL